MNSPYASAGAIARPQGCPDAPLHGRRLTLARVTWTAVTLLTVVLFVAGVPASFEYLQIPCAGSACTGPQPTVATIRMLGQLGIPIALYAAFVLALDVIFAVVCFAVAGLIVRHQPVSRVALLAALALLTFGGATFPNVLNVLVEIQPGWALPVAFVRYTGHVSFLSLFYLFSDGRFIPRWTQLLILLWAILGIPVYFLPDTSLDPHASPLAFVPMYAGFLGTAVFAQVYRYQRVAAPIQRQQTKWVVFGFAAAILTFLVFILFGAALPPGLQQDPLGFLVGNTVMHLSMLLIPLSIGFAILRYRLWDIDVIINRTLVYGILSAIVAGVYLLVVGGLGSLLRAEGNLLLSLLGAVLVAILFAPLRERLQLGVNRLMYGERDDPYRVLARLGQRLGETLEPQAVLPSVVQTVREALRLPYAAIALRQQDGLKLAASAGEPVPEPHRLPLVYQGESLGELVLGRRVGEEAFSPADRRLLDDLVRQVGVAVHAMRLTVDLQRSRERLVTAREEERRRLRHDLHDSLGPALASMSLQLAAVRNLVADRPDAAEILTTLKSQMHDAVADIRRLVYALRPPVLDELGLVEAVREYSARLSYDGLEVLLEAPGSLPPLSAAVEVAAYRIALEALANVGRHSGAHSCAVRFSIADGELHLDVADDGHGLGPNARTGTGLISMRERAQELGGRCEIETSPDGGTTVRVRLPLGDTDD